MILSIKGQNNQFINCLRVLPAFLVLMMICRGLLFWLSSSDTDPGFQALVGFKIFWMGLRFDLLILGFIFIPLTLLTWFSTKKIQSFYLSTAWFLIVTINFFNLSFFLKNDSHRYWPDHQAGTYFADFQHWMKAETGTTISLVIIIYLFILSIGLKSIHQALYKSKDALREKTEEEMSPREKFEQPVRQAVGALWPFFIVAIMARGTFTQHHLRREHAMITTSSHLNEIILNPQWTLDKVRP